MISLVYFIVVLSVLVLAHEFGHFITAKRLKVGVQIFSLGFGPTLWRTKKDETEYRISAIPIGGYVKMAGDEPAEKLEGKIKFSDIPKIIAKVLGKNNNKSKSTLTIDDVLDAVSWAKEETRSICCH